VTLADFGIEESSLVGLQIGEQGRLAATHGLLAGNLVGANVADPTFDFASLADVRTWENGTDLSAEVVPVPEVGPLIGK